MKDLTTGNSFKALIQFALPMLLSMIFQQVYSIVDSVIAGKYIGVGALGAVGASQPITIIFIAIAIGTGMGINVVISGYFGAKKYQRVKSCISTAVITCIVMSVVLTVVGLTGCNWMMHMLSTPKDIFGDAALYLRIYIMGIAFLMLYNAANSIFTALGDSVTPLIFLIFSSLLNIILDIVFVTTFHMGVSGVAWATFVAQGLASVLAVITVFVKVHKIKTKAYHKFNLVLLGKMSYIAIPSIMQQSFVSIGQLFVQGRINMFGSVVVAGFSAAFKIQMFVIAGIQTIGNAVSSFSAQNHGAGKVERIRQGMKGGFKISICLGLIFTGIAILGREPLMGMFLSGNGTEALATKAVGTQFLLIVAPFYFMISIKFVTDGFLRGLGEMKGFMISTFADLIVRVILSFALATPFGYVGIWSAWPIGWIFGTAGSVWFAKKANKHLCKDKARGM
ncbi:MAG: MATE family efflux transporter [Anaerostipes sp.]|nr:MATE family efflux transporter [Anaerostipes sp.]MDD3745791.1 MATE family efflux transporter [Anaerostipes sp.]